MKKQLPWIVAAVIIFITFGTTFMIQQQKLEHGQVQGVATGYDSPVTTTNAVEQTPDKLFARYLLACAGAITMLTILYLVSTMPRNERW